MPKSIGSRGSFGDFPSRITAYLVLPEGVLLWLLGGVDQWVLDEHIGAVALLDGEHVGMDGRMMMRTYGHPVLRAGFPAFGPENDVVDFAPGRRPVTPWHCAATIPCQNGPADMFRKFALLASDG